MTSTHEAHASTVMSGPKRAPTFSRRPATDIAASAKLREQESIDAGVESPDAYDAYAIAIAARNLYQEGKGET